MPILQGQLRNVIEWEEARPDLLFWKWANREIKKGSRLIIRPGQDAIFLHNGAIEGVFEKEGSYDLETEIIPFLSTLKGFMFGFNSGLRAEVLFVNTKEFTESWGTSKPILLPSQVFPGGLPVRAFGTFNFKAADYLTLIEKIAGARESFAVEDVKERVLAVLNQFLMKWISKEGKDMFNLQANSFEIGAGLQQDLDAELQKIGLAVTGFNVSSFNYPDEVQARINSAAGAGMIGNMEQYTRAALADSMGEGGNSPAAAAMQSAMGLAAGLQMTGNLLGGAAQPATPAPAPQAAAAAACSACGALISPGAKFCPECGAKNEPKTEKFCTNCGAKMPAGAKFCPECGNKA
ncbi:MAG: SPFH domain-containing protein [Christensenellaceae bacterium]|jgi:membrane protease subunit (stomatin/prohibitin family)|nr:SPFH domain-containing protein [Christensenellaceae bacterium]